MTKPKVQTRKVCDIFLSRLKSAGLSMPSDARIERTRAGAWQRRAGAWTWVIVGHGKWHDIGGYQSITKLSLCPNLDISTGRFGDIDVECGCPGGKCKGRATLTWPKKEK